MRTQLCPILCNTMGCSPPGFLDPQNFLGKNIGVGCHFLLQGIFQTQGSNPGLLHFRQMLYRLSHLSPVLSCCLSGGSGWAAMHCLPPCLPPPRGAQPPPSFPPCAVSLSHCCQFPCFLKDFTLLAFRRRSIPREGGNQAGNLPRTNQGSNSSKNSWIQPMIKLFFFFFKQSSPGTHIHYHTSLPRIAGAPRCQLAGV